MAGKRENGADGASSADLVTWMNKRDELVAQMGREGTWQPAFAPMLHEFAEALRMAAKLREEAEAELFVKSARSGRSYIHPGIAAADLEVRRASLILGRLDGMVKSEAAREPMDEPDALDELDAITEFSSDPEEDMLIRLKMAQNRRQMMMKNGRRR
ncbi:MAG TPA: hypothetical protein VGN08_13595 [Solirubrobacteraceae bacterium]|jgi:hypothetical protein